jgi:hypothetical protein
MPIPNNMRCIQGPRDAPANLFATVLPVLAGLRMSYISTYLLHSTCLGDLASCGRLSALELMGPISELPALPFGLKDLRFRSCEATPRIDSVSTLTKLRTLTLEWISGMDLTLIQAYVSLESLKLNLCPRVAAWPELGAFTALWELLVEFSSGLDWGSLAALTALTRLSIHFIPVDSDVEALASLTQLQDLALTNVFSNGQSEEDYWQGRLASTLTCLVSLHTLNLSCTPVGTMEWCSALPSLRSLNAGGNPFRSLEGFSDCPQVIEIKLSHSHALTSLSGLQKCSQLSRLELCNCSCISTLEPLGRCPTLTELDLRCCCQIPRTPQMLPKAYQTRPLGLQGQPARPRAPARPAQPEDH